MNKDTALASLFPFPAASQPDSDPHPARRAASAPSGIPPASAAQPTITVSHPATATADLPQLFLDWQHSTRQANLALLQQQLPKAHQLYQQALATAQQLLQRDPLQDTHLAAFVISHHNLADLALLEGEADTARTLLGHAYQQLWTLCSTVAPAPESLQLVLPHLQLCRRELAFFCQNFGSDAASSQLMRLPWPGARH